MDFSIQETDTAYFWMGFVLSCQVVLLHFSYAAVLPLLLGTIETTQRYSHQVVFKLICMRALGFVQNDARTLSRDL